MRTFVAVLVFSIFTVCVLCAGMYEGAECLTAEDKPGICRLRSNCSRLSPEQLKDANNLCGFSNGEAMVCCPEKTYQLLTEICSHRRQKQKLRNLNLQLIGGLARLEYQWRAHFTEKVKFTLINADATIYNNCTAESASIGGKEGDYYGRWCWLLPPDFNIEVNEFNFEIASHEHPYMVLLGWRNANYSISWNCAATLVHKSFVVTTANCVFKYGKPPDLARISEQRLIRRGRDKFAIDYDVEKVVIHESFDSSQLYNDIALLKIKLKQDLRDKPPSIPVCIWTRYDYPNTNFKTLGYGSPRYGLFPAVALRDSKSTLVLNANCSEFYNSSNTMLPDGLRESQLCGSDPERVSGGCKDDSGGPLQFVDTDELETPYLVGIASFGLECTAGKPGIYTRIYNFLEWIENKMRENLL